MIERFKLANHLLEHSNKWLSRTRDGSTIQIQLCGFRMLLFLRDKPT